MEIRYDIGPAAIFALAYQKFRTPPASPLNTIGRVALEHLLEFVQVLG